MRVALGLSIVALAAARAGAGTVTVLDAAGDVGAHASLAIGPDGLGLIAYYDATGGDLKVAHCTDVPCTAATLSRIDSDGDVGRFAALAIGSDGRGVVSYFDATNETVKVARCTDAACTAATTSTVAPGLVRGRTSLTVGTDGLPLVVFSAAPAGTTQPARLQIFHCADAACTTGQLQPPGPFLGGQVDLDTAVAVGGDGRPLIAFVDAENVPGPPSMALLHCTNPTCGAVQPQAPASMPLIGNGRVRSPSLAVAPDGLARLAYGRSYGAPFIVAEDAVFHRCTDAACGASTRDSFFAIEAYPSLALLPSGLPMVAWGRTDRLLLAKCTDPDCHGFNATCALVPQARPSLALGTDAVALAAAYAPGTGDLVVAHGIDDTCGDVTLSTVREMVVPEGDSGTTLFTGLFDPLFSLPVAWPTVDYETRDGSATAADDDYRPAVGSLTFQPGPPPFYFPTPYPTPFYLVVNGDTVDEPDETFYVDFANPMNVVLGTSTLRVIIRDDDPGQLSAGDCAVVEGDSGPVACVVEVRLGAPSPVPVTVDFATAGGTATSGVDFLAASGTLTFDPGSLVQMVTVSVLGDPSVELDETFFVNLSNPVEATILDGTGLGTILDDDAGSLSTLELTHGSRVSADLAAVPGPVAQPDLYRIFQDGYSSWEIVVDGVSGDVAPGLLVERLAEDNSTVLQTASDIGTGSARSMRWQRRAATAEARHHIRVGSTSCTTDCGPDDTYRLRAYETTGRIPRFNNSSSQVTVLVLQNATGDAIEAAADFWSASGVRLHTEVLSLAPRAVAIVNTAAVGALAGVSGSITVTSDGPYGGIAGKAVALEPATGFAFDSPMAFKPR